MLVFVLQAIFSIYGVSTEKVLDKVNGHGACVRDTTWHPLVLISVSFILVQTMVVFTFMIEKSTKEY